MINISDIFNGKILIVDDLEANVKILENILIGSGYRSVSSTMNPREVCDLHRRKFPLASCARVATRAAASPSGKKL